MSARARVLACLGALLVLACSSPEERAERARSEAREALAHGDRAAALAALRRLPHAQESPEAVLDHAALLAGAGELAQASWILESAARSFPERADVRLAQAHAALLLNDLSGARAAALAVPTGSELHPAALVVIAQAELQLGSVERALAVLRDAERLYPDRVEARLVRVAVLATEGRHAEARGLLDELKRSGAALPEPLRDALRRLDVGLYAAQAQAGQGGDARAGLHALVKEDPSDALAWQALVQVLWREEGPRPALDLVERAVAEEPARVALYPLAASLHTALGEPDEAEAILRRLVERAPTAASYTQLAQLHAERRDGERALAAYAQAVEALPSEPLLARLHAEALVDFGSLAAARREIARFAELAPDDPHGDYLRARVALAEGDAQEAISLLERLVPELDQPYTQYWLGRALEARGDRAGAERRYGLALTRNPLEPALYAPLIRLAEQRGDWRATAATAELLVRRMPAVAEGWQALCAALVQLGSGAEAERVARGYAALFPNAADAPLLAARALRVQGRHDAALAELAAARERFGSSPEIEAERALTLGMAGRAQEGLDVLGPALAESPDSALLHRTRASLLFAGRRGGEGSREVERALALDGEDPSPLRIRAEYHAAAGDLEDARRDCERYLAARPDDAGMHFVLGFVHERAGRRAEAASAYRRAAELDPRAYAPRNNLALLLAESDLEAALAAAQEAYALAAENADVLDTLGWLYLRAGRVERSISLLEDAARAAPGEAETELHLALAYREGGRADDARRLLVALRERADAPAAQRERAEEALRSLP